MALVDKMTAGPPAPLRRSSRSTGKVVTLLPGPYVRVPHHDPPLVLQIGLSPKGRLICTGLLVGWSEDPTSDSLVEVTARAVHEIKLGAILKELEPLPEDGGIPQAGKRKRSDVSPVPSWLLQSVPTVRPPHPGQAGHSDEHFENFANLYKRALVVAPGAPMKWLAEQLDIGDATPYRWRDEAERRGLLPKRDKARRGPTRTRRPPTRKGTR